MSDIDQSLSYVVGSTDEPLCELTIGAALDKAAARFGSRDAIVARHQNQKVTYAQLKERVDALAAGFIALGLQPGERVGIWAPTCVEWTVTQYATAKAGLILVTINPAYRPAEFEYAVNKVGCRALVTAESFKTSNYIAMLNSLVPELTLAKPGALRTQKLSCLEFIITLGEKNHPGCLQYDNVLGGGTDADIAALRSREAALQPQEPINIQFTSGTTGSPKGATLSHYNILNNAYFVGRAMRITEKDRLCIPVPLYHCFGMVMGNLTCMQFGAAAVYPAASFDAASTLEAVEAEKCTGLYGVPTMFVAELEMLEKNKYDVSTLRTGVMAGAPCPTPVMERVIRDLNMSEVTIGYGMTETSPISWQTAADDPFDRRISTVGKVHPHIEVMVADENGNPVPRGVQGEFMTRGYSVMLGYWGDEDITAEAISSDGWMRTGDLGIIDDNDYGNITGRLKDMVIRGGENIFPREIEEFLFRCQDVQDVQVFGVPNDKYGEELCAWIVPKPNVEITDDSIRHYCKDQIAHFKIPRYIRFVDAFPMTVTGKAQKFEMRKAMCLELGLEEQNSALP